MPLAIIIETLHDVAVNRSQSFGTSLRLCCILCQILDDTNELSSPKLSAYKLKLGPLLVASMITRVDGYNALGILAP